MGMIATVSMAHPLVSLLSGMDSPALPVPYIAPPPHPPGLDLRQAQVIAISTGTKCLSGEYISEQGLAVHDCHAEVIARRAFLRFLYAQLELFLR